MNIHANRGVSFSAYQPKSAGALSSMTPGRPGGVGGLAMKVTDPRHLVPASVAASPERVAEGFAGALQAALQKVEKLDSHSKEMTRKAIFAPDSVEVHEVMLAAEKARFALNLTRTLSEGFVRAYREVTNPR